MLVSIIIPTYNRSKLLKETLISVQKQTYTDWECIIVDDCSNDNTKLIAKEFIEKDKRYVYFQRPYFYPKGASSCRNYGFGLSKGKYIQWLDDDDLLSEKKIELQVKKLESINNTKIFTTCDWDLYWPEKKIEFNNLLKFNDIIKPDIFFYEIRRQLTFLPIHTFLMHRELILNAGNWNINLTINDDAEFITRVILECDFLINTEGCFVLYRDHTDSRLSKNKSTDDLESFILSLKLIHCYLKRKKIECKPYFKWKLFNIFFGNWKYNRSILNRHYYFFKENGINLKLARYYFIKYKIYKKLYTWYKNGLKKYK